MRHGCPGNGADGRHKNVYSRAVKTSEFVRWLKAQGVKFEKFGKGSHLKVTLKGRSSVIPMHPSKEIAKGTLESIKKDLGLK